jgi:glycosyltransferase involved in cell wall biosynthesis
MIPAKEICLVSLEYKPYRGSGLTIYAEELARGLSELGHHVTVLAGQRPGLPVFHQVDGVDVYRAAIGRFNWFTYCWRAVKMLRNLQHKISFDVVHFLDVYFAYAYRGPFVASVWQSFRQALRACDGRPCHTGNVDRLGREIYYRTARRFMERPSLTRAGRLIASCRSTTEEFVTYYRVDPERIDLVPQGIDTSFFRPVAADALRHRLGLDGLRLILFVGFATPRKGLEYLAQAMTMLPDDVHLLIVGRWAPGCQERFRRAAGSAMDRVHEVGFVADSERPAYYSLADLYVSPSVLEGLGITPVEAMSCGTPAVVTSASSGPEEVGDAGLIVPPCDPEALALGIRRLLDDDRMRTELGRRGRQRAVRHFSYRRMAELTVGSYERFLESGPEVK